MSILLTLSFSNIQTKPNILKDWINIWKKNIKQ